MNNPMQQVLEAQRALADTQRSLGAALVEGSNKVFQLNMQAAARALNNPAMRQMPGTENGGDTQAGLRSGMDSAASYARQWFDAVSGTNTQVMRLMQQQAADWQRLVSALGSAGMNASAEARDAAGAAAAAQQPSPIITPAAATK